MPRASAAATVWVHKPRLLVATGLAMVLALSALFVFVSTEDSNQPGTLESPTSCVSIGTENTCIELEVVREPDERQLGLSGRDSLAKDAGMLFDFADEGTRCMWMPDMNFAIDIIWLSQNQEVVDVMSGIAPDTYPESFCGAEPAHYVIEVNSGVTAEAGVKVGQIIEL